MRKQFDLQYYLEHPETKDFQERIKAGKTKEQTNTLYYSPSLN